MLLHLCSRLDVLMYLLWLLGTQKAFDKRSIAYKRREQARILYRNCVATLASHHTSTMMSILIGEKMKSMNTENKNNTQQEKLSEKISQLRSYLKLSQAKFAAPLGLSPTQIARYEKGIFVPSSEIIKKISEEFGVDERLFLDSGITVEEAVTKHDIISEVAMRLKTAREDKGWSQTELAKRIGVPQSTVTRIEAGQRFPTKQTATNIASALDVGIDWLMRGNEDRKKYPADQKMTDWLWEHPDVREMIWNMMKNEK